MTRPWETLETVATPEGPLALRRRGDSDFLITINGRILMTSTAHRSEDALAELACADAGARPKARVLVGGLGMGFTLRAALDALRSDARVTVAELNPVVADWCRGPLAPLTGHPLDDPRATLRVGDVADAIVEAAGGQRLHVIMIDLYEGPQSRIPAKHPLYGPSATANVYAALEKGGTYAVWCEQPSPAFERILRTAGFEVELARRGHGASVHLIYVAKRA